MDGQVVEEMVVLTVHAAVVVLGLVSAWLLLTQRLAPVSALIAVILYGALVEVVCVLFLMRWWHLVPGFATALRTGIPFVLADATILLALFGRRALLARGQTTMLVVAGWCAVGSLLGYLQLFLGSGY